MIVLSTAFIEHEFEFEFENSHLFKIAYVKRIVLMPPKSICLSQIFMVVITSVVRAYW